MAEDWLSLKEAAAMAGYHIEHMRELARQGRVRARKVVTVWLVDRKSLDTYLHEQEKRGEKRGPKPTS